MIGKRRIAPLDERRASLRKFVAALHPARGAIGSGKGRWSRAGGAGNAARRCPSMRVGDRVSWPARGPRRPVFLRARGRLTEGGGVPMVRREFDSERGRPRSLHMFLAVDARKPGRAADRHGIGAEASAGRVPINRSVSDDEDQELAEVAPYSPSRQSSGASQGPRVHHQQDQSALQGPPGLRRRIAGR